MPPVLHKTKTVGGMTLDNSGCKEPSQKTNSCTDESNCWQFGANKKQNKKTFLWGARLELLVPFITFI